MSDVLFTVMGSNGLFLCIHRIQIIFLIISNVEGLLLNQNIVDIYSFDSHDSLYTNKHSLLLNIKTMLTQPEILQNSQNTNEPKRKRRFKIFQTRNKPTDPLSQNLLIESFTTIKQQLITQPQLQKEQLPNKQKQLVKLPPKDNLQQQFYYGIDDDDQIQMLQVRMNGYSTIQSNQFGCTKFMSSTPSFMFKNNQLVINQESILYHSVKQIKDHYSNIDSQFEEIKASINLLDRSVTAIVQEEQARGKIKEVQLFLQQIRAENDVYDRKIKEIDYRIESLEYIMELQQRSRKNNIPPQEKQQIKVMDQSGGLQLLLKQDGDQFAESHYLPAELIARYMKERQIQREQQEIQRATAHKINIKNIQIFHPILKIHQHQYKSLVSFIQQQLPQRKEESIKFKLLFRRGTTDLQSQSIGEKTDLEYKENLLFLVKTSTGKRIGGFISNDLIEEETMQDSHAFLFTLQDSCHKFKIKEQCQSQAFMASKHYIVTFSSDLMISANCLEEESYCEWPSSYASKDGDSYNTWFAGDFWFMIQHIQVFEVVQGE